MAAIDIPLEDDMKKRLECFPWADWKEVAREEAYKRVILEDYLKTGAISDIDWKFCERIDWHPIGERAADVKRLNLGFGKRLRDMFR